jgi:hypothetical protein
LFTVDVTDTVVLQASENGLFSFFDLHKHYSNFSSVSRTRTSRSVEKKKSSSLSNSRERSRENERRRRKMQAEYVLTIFSKSQKTLP